MRRDAQGTGAARIVEVLEGLGVDLVFGLPGVHNLALWKALNASAIRLIGVRHEQAAVYAADGYARATGRLGVAAVTTGPGAANTLGATGEAMASGTPILVIATEIPTTLRRAGISRGVLHETRDQASMFGSVTKARLSMQDANSVATTVADAAAEALGAPSGPVYVGVPTDLLSAIVPWRALESRPPELPNPLELAPAVSLLEQARAPLIWAGGGALRSEAGAAVGELARRLAAPVVTTHAARGLLAPDHPCALPGPIHLPELGGLWDEADLVIAVGTEFDGMMTQNWAMPAPKRLIAVNVDRGEATKNYRPDVLLLGDARQVLEKLVPQVTPRGREKRLTVRLRALAKRVDEVIQAEDLAAHQMLCAMRDELPSDAVVVADMCVAGYWMGGFHPVPAPRKLAYPVGWGTLGFGFPASLGAAAAGTGRAICVTGDGGFLFACGELATAAQEHLPVTIVLVDDGGYGMLRFDQLSAGDEPFGVDLHTPDFVELARAFGVPATRVDGFGEEFVTHLRESFATPGPVAIVVEAALRPPPTTSARWYRRSGRLAAADQESAP